MHELVPKIADTAAVCQAQATGGAARRIEQLPRA
jgi:hypothetical protein